MVIIAKIIAEIDSPKFNWVRNNDTKLLMAMAKPTKLKKIWIAITAKTFFSDHELGTINKKMARMIKIQGMYRLGFIR